MAEDFAACGRLLAAAPGEPEFDALVAGMDKGMQGRKFDAVPSALQMVVNDLHIEQETAPGANPLCRSTW